jgi:nucleoside-diphosphate-sugar epimerase
VRVVVFGATGNLGSSLMRLLASDARVDSLLGVARRRPQAAPAGTEWAEADIARDELAPLLEGADVVVHAAWLIQPSRDPNLLTAVNVGGTQRLLDAVAGAGVGALVYASSVGAYSPGPKDRRVDEDWPVDGVHTSLYSRHKAEIERRLDELERSRPSLRVVRMRPGLIFKRTAATGVRRLFAGPFLPGTLLRRGLIPFVPSIDGLRVQVVHTDDVAAAFCEAVMRDVRGAFNVAAEPVVDAALVAELLSARPVRVGRSLARAAVSASWQLHLQPTPPGWVDLALAVPLLDSARASELLGWAPQHGARETMLELLDGLRAGSGEETPPLAPSTSGRARLRELATGVGRRGGV